MSINMTLLGQMITFAIFVAIMVKFVWPHLHRALEERRKKIADGLAAAQKGHQDLEVAQHKVKEIIREAKAQATVIIEQANQRAHRIDEEAKEAARDAAEHIKKLAQADIERQMQHAKTELMHQTSALAIDCAERLLKQSVGASQQPLLLSGLKTALASKA